MVIDASSISGNKSLPPVVNTAGAKKTTPLNDDKPQIRSSGKDAFVPKTEIKTEIKIDTSARPEKPEKPQMNKIGFLDGIGIWNAPSTTAKYRDNKKAEANYEKQKNDYHNKMELYLLKQMKKQGIDTNVINDGDKILRRPTKPEKPEVSFLDGIGIWNAPRLIKEKNQYEAAKVQYEKDMEAYLKGLEKHIEIESKNKKA